jgi:hypothetical protein
MIGCTVQRDLINAGDGGVEEHHIILIYGKSRRQRWPTNQEKLLRVCDHAGTPQLRFGGLSRSGNSGLANIITERGVVGKNRN